MEDTHLQMKDMNVGDNSMNSVNKIQSNRSYNTAQEFELPVDGFQQGYRTDRNTATKADCSYCGFDYDQERRSSQHSIQETM